jgi:hypothetical protein
MGGQVVIHVGSGMNHGHYVCLSKIHDQWFLFDDESVEVPPVVLANTPAPALKPRPCSQGIEESQIHTCFGSSQEGGGNYSGYILLYQKARAQIH